MLDALRGRRRPEKSAPVIAVFPFCCRILLSCFVKLSLDFFLFVGHDSGSLSLLLFTQYNSRLITSQTQPTLQEKHRDAPFIRRHEASRPEPNG